MGWLVGLSPGPFGDGAHHPDHAPHLACGSVRCSGGCRDSRCCPQEATSPGKLGQQQHSQDLLHLSAKNKPKQRTREGSGEEKMAFSGSQVLAKVLHTTPFPISYQLKGKLFPRHLFLPLLLPIPGSPPCSFAGFGASRSLRPSRLSAVLGRFTEAQLFVIPLALTKRRQIHPPVRVICGLLCCILERVILCILQEQEQF